MQPSATRDQGGKPQLFVVGLGPGADTWITPNDQFFVIKHFNLPALTEADYRLAISGLVLLRATKTYGDDMTAAQS